MRLTSRSTRRAATTQPRRLRRVVTGLVGVLATVGSLLVLAPAPAGAIVGIDDYPARLKNAGQNALVDPWNFYNRQCTSFVAWRLNNDRGVPFHNYYLGVHWGNASNWANAARKVGVVVDDKPTPGSIAWWAKGSPGSSSGHVAYVASVNGTAIGIEEYNWARVGYYGTRVIDRSSKYWPSGFLHIDPPAMKLLSRPTITGTAEVGQVLTAGAGSWTPAGATYSYQWYADGVAISGATAETFRLTAAQLGKPVVVRVTASQTNVKSGAASSVPTAPVAPGTIRLKASPTVSGTPQVGQPLTSTKGTWGPTVTAAYQWLADGTPVAGATTPTYAPTAAELGKTMAVRVTATRPGYTTLSTDVVVPGAVAPGSLALTQRPAIAGTARVGQTLTATPGSWAPEPSDLRYQWYAGGTPIAGATTATFTPGASERGKALSVRVTAQEPGYAPATSESVATAAVAVGTFRTTQAPRVSGVPRVGQTLTVDTGQWTPTPRLVLQWLADGAAIPGATGTGFTLTPAQLGTAISVRITATAAGYQDTTSVTAPTADVAAGTLTATAAPSVTPRPRVGRPVTAAPGVWAQPGATATYQWAVDGMPVAKATTATFTPSEAHAGRDLSVLVRIAAPGYAPVTRTLTAGPVTYGDAVLSTQPTVTGTARLGEVLRVVAGSPTPATAAVTYQWYRGTARIEGAVGTTYRLTKADVGRRVTLRVRVQSPGWVGAAYVPARTAPVQTVARLHTWTRVVDGRIKIRVGVTTPGLERTRGTVTLTRGEHVADRSRLRDRHARVETKRLAPGKRRVVVTYRDTAHGLVARKEIVVRIR